MAPKHLPLFLFIISLFLPFLSYSTCQPLNNETDRLSLLAFKQQITDDPFQALSSWNDSLHFCQWNGITCSSRRARVVSISLPSQRLSGSLSPSISNLSFLRTIDLRGNNLRGKIPQDIGRLSRLKYIFLMNNNFKGEIPSNLSSCSELQIINFNYNNLTGIIPTDLSRLTNLVALHLSANQLTGGIPPVLGNMTSLVNLSIAQNFLGGTIPDDLGRLRNLEFLQLSNTNLSGSIPPSIFNLSRMSILAMAFNHLVGTLPSNIGTDYFPNLRQLLLGVNGFSGTIPSSLSNISTLQIIDIPDNNFVGIVPDDFGRLTNLTRLNVGRNSLGNEDPNAMDFINSLTNCSKLQMLSIDSNHFSGELPETISNLSITMNRLLLGGNRLSGRIPSGITNLINLIAFNVSWNQFEGPIVPDIGIFFNLRQLYMNNNRFSGGIPFTIGNLTELLELRLDGNLFEGSIPLSLGNCQQLQLLNLSGNSLNGSVPLQVFGLSSLTLSFNIARNSLSGVLPDEIGNFKNLKEMDLSENEFSGSIPDGLGRCSSLEHVFMQGNLLNGSIPSSISDLKGIQDLDLSRNSLRGNIPDFLQDLVFLRCLNLSYNHFEGQVPRNGVFSNGSVVALNGNDGLCGGIGGLGVPACSSTIRRGKTNLKVVIGTVSGVLASSVILCFVIAFVLKRSRRKGTIASYSDDWNSKFSYRELHKATNGFSSDKLIGRGGFASVYKGFLSEDGKVIAVKVLKIQEKGISKIYVAECEALRNIKHRNLVKVLGGCSDVDSEGQDFKAIVLEFMPNGSLEKWLHSNDDDDASRIKNFDNIFQRLSIAIDVASALEYLHHYCHVPIAHCDLKPDNVLLDEDFCAHLSDFGLAKVLRKHLGAGGQAGSSSIGIRGSVGYVAPEYGMGGEASLFGDVYSFGILLLEMFTGRRPTDDLFEDGLDLHKFAKSSLPNNVKDILDPRLLLVQDEGEAIDISFPVIDLKELDHCLAMIIRIGVECSNELPQERMNIKDSNRNLQLIRDKLLGNY